MVVREKERGRLRIGSVTAENKAFFLIQITSFFIVLKVLEHNS
jgi:hypothetical protein